MRVFFLRFFYSYLQSKATRSRQYVSFIFFKIVIFIPIPKEANYSTFIFIHVYFIDRIE